MMALILVLVLRAATAQNTSAPISAPLSTFGSPLTAPDVPAEQSDPVSNVLDGPDESTPSIDPLTNAPPITLSASTVAQIVQINAGLGAPTGPPPIPTESSAYSYAAGYRGWTPQLAQANVDALAALSAQVWAGTVTSTQFQAIVQAPGTLGAGQSVAPPYSADSLYYSPNQFGGTT